MSEPYYTDSSVTLHHGDCLDVLRNLPGGSVDAVVTDPPYGLVFMGKAWDDHVDGKGFQAWCELWATECLRVLKPGGHMLAFGGSRTWHRLAAAVEDAGFEIRDSIAWLYGSGFPKSLDVSKAIDKAAGAAREEGRPGPYSARRPRVVVEAADTYADGVGDYGSSLITTPATPDAERWQGWGTALKPAFEPIVVGRKPLGGTVAANVLAHGTGALNIDGCRVGDEALPEQSAGQSRLGTFERGVMVTPVRTGRWPTNVILDESQAAELDRQSGALTSGKMQAGTRPKGDRTTYGRDAAGGYETTRDTPGDSGGASRFFPTFRYEAKAPAIERPRHGDVAHPTVKPLDLMRWLVRLVTPPGGTVLEPFAGSGTTVEACLLEGFACIAIEREADYLPLIRSRIDKPLTPALDLGALA